MKNPRKTLNDRRSAGQSSVCAESAQEYGLSALDGPLSLSEELIRLGCLRQAGLITDFEFDHEKSLLLDRCRHQPEGDDRRSDPEDRWSSGHRSEQY